MLQYGALRNAGSNRPYRGMNVLLLNIATMVKGYTDPRWLTYKNAESMGGTVRKGEKGTQVVFWNFLTVADSNAPAVPSTTSPRDKKIPFVRMYTVFNVQQCDGLNLPVIDMERPELGSNEVADKMMALAEVTHYGSKAAYISSVDKIMLPTKDSFKSLDHYYATSLHELVHWTGNASRLDRDLNNRFGSEAYAFEELIAEMSAAFLCTHALIPFEDMQHPEYIASWLKVLKGDNKAVFTAASKAQQAADYVVEKSGVSVDITEEAVA